MIDNLKDVEYDIYYSVILKRFNITFIIIFTGTREIISRIIERQICEVCLNDVEVF